MKPKWLPENLVETSTEFVLVYDKPRMGIIFGSAEIWPFHFVTQIPKFEFAGTLGQARKFTSYDEADQFRDSIVELKADDPPVPIHVAYVQTTCETTFSRTAEGPELGKVKPA